MKSTYPNLGAFPSNNHPDRPAMFRWPSGLFGTDGHIVAGPFDDRFEAEYHINMLVMARRRKYIYVLSRVAFALGALVVTLFLLCLR